MTPTESIVAPHQCYCGKSDCVVAFGYCHCKCGEKVKISTITHKQHRWVEGQPLLYLNGHSRIIRLEIEDALSFKLEGVYCRLIPLTQGFYAIVNESDYLWLMQWKWSAMWNGTHWYAIRGGKQKDGHRAWVIYMHRVILGLTKGDSEDTDHKDAWDTFNNSRLNLRRCSSDENGHNSLTPKSNKSGRKGVYQRSNGRFVVRIRVKGKRIYVGSYKTFDEACRAREEAEKKYHGEFARAR